MDEEKKPEASGEGPERLEQYLIQEQVQQSHDSQGECYLATNETSGATALVRKHPSEEDVVPEKDWRARRTSSSTRGSATCPPSAPSRRPRRSGSEERGARQPGSLVPALPSGLDPAFGFAGARRLHL